MFSQTSLISVYLFSSFFIISQITPITSEKISLAIVYNSKDNEDGLFQESLFRGTFVGLMEADRESKLNPVFLDLGIENMEEGIERIFSNKSKTILSLLSAHELNLFISKFLRHHRTTQTDLVIFTPRVLSKHHFNKGQLEAKNVRLISLQPNESTRAIVLLNRIAKVQTRALSPILDDQSQLPLLGIYHHLASKYFPGVIRFKKPIFLFPSNHRSNQTPHLVRTSFLKPRPKRETNKTVDSGILLLSSKWRPEASDGFWSEDHYFRWFSHNPIQEIKTGFQVLFGMYSVQYVGSTNWDSRLRRNIIQELGNFSDPSPNVLSTVLAFDAATVAAYHAEHGQVPTSLSGMSGEIKFDSEGFRTGVAFFQGISALSAIQSPYAMLLQNSSWILEDALRVGRNESRNEEFDLTEYQIATSSIITPKPLIQYAAANTSDGKSCIKPSVEVMTRDPFTQQSYSYFFGAENLPLTLLVPNQFGYGLKIFCETKTVLKTILEIGCTSDGNSVAPSVHCFQARSRQRRSPLTGTGRRIHNSFYSNQRQDNTNVLSYDIQPPPAMSPPMSPYMANFYYPGNNNSGSPMTTATEEATMTTTEAAATEAPGPKLPDLRGILKGALPFVGACVGAATGCSVCVVVLGRLPLGALPAVCTGPCFVTTFSNCGGLLGRTFAETTVICTELFRQGRLDTETFLVDAEFGNWIAKESAHTLKGYQQLATPIVSWMKSSETVTKIVEIFASPWAEHMMFLMGRSTKFSLMGFLVHNFGMSLCGAVGQFEIFLENGGIGINCGALIGGIILIITLLTSKNRT